jgi:hypothetical protein
MFRLAPAHTIQQVYQLGSPTMTDWAKLCREAMLDYVLGSSQKIGGPYKTFEIEDSMFVRHKCNIGHKV